MQDLETIYMRDLSQNLNPTANMQSKVVPLEQRYSQKLGVWDYIKEIAPIIGMTALGGIIGRLVLGKHYGTQTGSAIGGIYGTFFHWQKNRGSQLGVENIHKEMTDAISVEHLKTEVKKEQEIIDGIDYLTSDKAKNTSYADYVTSRRQQANVER